MERKVNVTVSVSDKSTVVGALDFLRSDDATLFTGYKSLRKKNISKNVNDITALRNYPVRNNPERNIPEGNNPEHT